MALESFNHVFLFERIDPSSRNMYNRELDGPLYLTVFLSWMLDLKHFDLAIRTAEKPNEGGESTAILNCYIEQCLYF